VFLLLTLMFSGLYLWVTTAEASELVDLITTVTLVSSPLLVLVLAGFLIANGAEMIQREGRRPANLLSLGTGLGLIGLVAALAAAALARDPWLLAVCSAVALVVGYVGFLFVSFLLYSVVYGRIGHRPGMGAIVVLGSGLQDGARVPPLLAGRLDRAAAVFRDEVAAGRSPLLITSGGQGTDEGRSEAAAMARYLVDRGLPAGNVVVEDRSKSTRENLLNSTALLDGRSGNDRLLVVTNNFHVLRSAVLTRRLGIRADVIGAPTARYFLPSASLREFAALFVQYRYANIAVCLALAATAPLAVLTGAR